VYDQKRRQFRRIEEYVQWHNEVKPHPTSAWALKTWRRLSRLSTGKKPKQRKAPAETGAE
ncbi:hypothetical protein KEJ19_07550, partial [Candidatus Bathyarchaeota archaeon]|nr:hypothetical protein [Candidatus Bathyarchaeota archaeon]